MDKFKKVSLYAGAIFIVAGFGIYSAIRYLDNPKRATAIVYSEKAMLLELWNNYKAENIESGSHRTLDKSQDNITTSEGQSYTMLRAVWMDDKKTFDESWQFTKNNMQRPSDHLLSWKFGKNPDASYGVLKNAGGQNTASDADVDTALSLLMAYSRWNETAYLFQAKEMINSIWEQEVVLINGKPVLAANDLEKNSPDSIVVNPSYFSPYSFRLFSQADPKHDWFGLIDNSYTLLNSLSKDSLGSASNSGLPPNWIKINRVSGALIPNASPNLDTDYGYDALRIPFRLALDYEWFKDPRDKQTLENFKFLNEQWQQNQSLRAVYGHNGTTVGNYETPAMYGGAIGYFNIVNPVHAREVYDQKLQSLYSQDRQQWKNPLSYYDDNWAWFGIALTQHELPNLAAINN